MDYVTLHLGTALPRRLDTATALHAAHRVCALESSGYYENIMHA